LAEEQEVDLDTVAVLAALQLPLMEVATVELLLQLLMVVVVQEALTEEVAMVEEDMATRPEVVVVVNLGGNLSPRGAALNIPIHGLGTPASTVPTGTSAWYDLFPVNLLLRHSIF